MVIIVLYYVRYYGCWHQKRHSYFMLRFSVFDTHGCYDCLAVLQSTLTIDSLSSVVLSLVLHCKYAFTVHTFVYYYWFVREFKRASTYTRCIVSHNGLQCIQVFESFSFECLSSFLGSLFSSCSHYSTLCQRSGQARLSLIFCMRLCCGWITAAVAGALQ